MNDLFDGQSAAAAGPVDCLGQTFPSDAARREHFLGLLRERLQDPEFRKIEGFPVGTDADILAMSDPPYYTACPNPFIEAFVTHDGRPYDPELAYRREPMTIDVSVGKTDPLYKAHGYHTKVPHLAIVPSILHYTEPGDLVLDGFAGSGMTGVAAQWCGAAPAAYRHQLEGEWKRQGKEPPRWGARRVILNDLSPAATFIAANYNLPFDVGAFAAAGRKLLKELEQELGWMYETLHTDGKTKGRIDYTVWSEVFACPECAGQIDFVAEALDAETKRVRDSFPCPYCGVDLNKDRLERVLESRIDPATGEPWQRVKFRPALISYVAAGLRREKRPDAHDLGVLERIEALPLPPEMPTARFPIEAMYHGSRIAPKGFLHTHHFFLPRAGQALAVLWKKAKEHPDEWHRVFTDAAPEAIIDRFKHKALPEYQHLMQRCFAEYYRVLKPGRWMTVVFSNSKAAVWNAIQVALQQAGFVVAEVTALDKLQGSYRQVTSATAMKQDLVISAYKPNGGLEDRFKRNGATLDSAWDFVRTHLRQLPAVKVTQGDFQELVNNVERDPRRIKDRMDAWFIRHDAPVPLSSPEFIAELAARFEMVDGMAFLPEQRVEYEKARARIPQARQAELFISDERSAIDWLTQFLGKRPSTRSEILPEYMPQIGAAKKKGEIIPELGQLLDDSFLCYDGAGEVPSQIHSYLSTNHKDLRGLAKDHPALVAKAQDRWYVPDPNKAQDKEKKREKALQKEFATYQAHTGRRLKEFRLEVLRAGFKAAWAAKDYRAIVAIAAKIPEEALQEDEKLLLWYDQALTRMESGS
ncbi:DNA methyltransferase [uncultured Thiodictyon sp.]|uniref:DNA methyltransferase n=1 Tax=uncultured Thiodictyon sp. TaxID=1846217 RepID=UPI0025DF6372|nr:DNA methyltransferase [uncultured Thiodictyon sp.]